jgi:hypothetical protein
LYSELALFGLSVANDVEDDLVAKGFLGVHDASSSPGYIGKFSFSTP